jgi:hypothetical protein
MNEPSSLLERLSEEAVWRLEEACCRFEGAYQAGRRPRLEDFETGPEGDERLALLRELLRLEVHYRRRAGEGPSAADYQTRFPEATAVLQEVFASPPGPDGPPAPPGPAAGQGEAARLAVTVAQLEHALAARVRVEQAIGVLAERHRLRPRQAFELLRSVARAQGRRVLEMATEVVESATNPLLRIPEELAKPPMARRRGRRLGPDAS